MLTSNAVDPTPDQAGAYAIPDFERDARTTALYTETLDRRIKAHASDREADVQRGFAKRRDALEIEIRNADVFVEDRRTVAERAMAAYRARYPSRVKKTRVLRPSLIETLLSLGSANRLYRAADDALSMLNKALSKQRGFAAEHEALDRDLARALAHAAETANKAVGSPEWLASILASDVHFAGLKRMADAIAHERARARRVRRATRGRPGQRS
jgi:hypothetical protein